MSDSAVISFSHGMQVPARPVLELVVQRKPESTRRTLAQVLLELKLIQHDDLMRALELQSRQAGNLGDILIARDLVTPDALTAALAQQYGTSRLMPLADDLPDPTLIDRLGVERCLRLQCIPWRRAGDVTVIACARPELFDRSRNDLQALFGAVAMAIISPEDLHDVLLKTRRNRLKLWAETCVSERESCRMMKGRWFGNTICFGLLVVLLVAWIAPLKTLFALTLLATLCLCLTSCLKIAAAVAAHRGTDNPDQDRDDLVPLIRRRKPVVSVLVPLYEEPRVVARLINRLSRLTWPRELLDILLVVEENDQATRAALCAHDLPRWMRVIIVPDAPLRTKPRALNYAMLFARGTIVGVYDAEDAPDPDQIHRVVRSFQDGPPNLACVQGVLDFYNARTNWISRCFTIEYATWFRIILPGMQRLGLAVPLGGTTLFFRRDILESLGGWDAHNVTEDADLGIRLARHGYYTHLLPTTTQEEANCRVLPWIRQRSRWLKGYAVTWLVHMRNPGHLWAQLGPKRFFGVQILFLGTLVQFMLAPLLWTFWLMALGLGHPLQGMLGTMLMIGFVTVFLMSEVVTFVIGYLALRSPSHRGLRFWLPALHGYFPLAVLAVYKALWELIAAPFYWDKTAHGDHYASCDTIRVARPMV